MRKSACSILRVSIAGQYTAWLQGNKCTTSLANTQRLRLEAIPFTLSGSTICPLSTAEHKYTRTQTLEAIPFTLSGSTICPLSTAEHNYPTYYIDSYFVS